MKEEGEEGERGTPKENAEQMKHKASAESQAVVSREGGLMCIIRLLQRAEEGTPSACLNQSLVSDHRETKET